MRRVSGITGAGPLWAEIIRAAAKRYGDQRRRFKRPEGIVDATICPISGQRHGPHCPAQIQERFVDGQAPKLPCKIHRRVAIDQRNGLRADGLDCPSANVKTRVFAAFPAPYRGWAAERGIPQPPTVDSPLCAPRKARSEQAAIRIRFPTDGDHFYVDPDLRREYQRIPLEVAVKGQVSEVRWLVDGRRVARAGFPYHAKWTIAPGRHTVIAELPDGKRSAPIRIRVR